MNDPQPWRPRLVKQGQPAVKFWDEREDDLMIRLRKSGLSASKIGKVLKRSRNAVLGRCFRLGLCEPARPERA